MQVIPTVGVGGDDSDKKNAAMLKHFRNLVDETASKARFLSSFQRSSTPSSSDLDAALMSAPSSNSAPSSKRSSSRLKGSKPNPSDRECDDKTGIAFRPVPSLKRSSSQMENSVNENPALEPDACIKVSSGSVEDPSAGSMAVKHDSRLTNPDAGEAEEGVACSKVKLEVAEGDSAAVVSQRHIGGGDGPQIPAAAGGSGVSRAADHAVTDDIPEHGAMEIDMAISMPTKTAKPATSAAAAPHESIQKQPVVPKAERALAPSVKQTTSDSDGSRQDNVPEVRTLRASDLVAEPPLQRSAMKGNIELQEAPVSGASRRGAGGLSTAAEANDLVEESALNQLMAVVGGAADRKLAQQLLQQADGDVGRAINFLFDRPQPNDHTDIRAARPAPADGASAAGQLCCASRQTLLPVFV